MPNAVGDHREIGQRRRRRSLSVTRGLDPVRSTLLGPDANYLFVAPFVMDPANAEPSVGRRRVSVSDERRGGDLDQGQRADARRRTRQHDRDRPQRRESRGRRHAQGRHRVERAARSGPPTTIGRPARRAMAGSRRSPSIRATRTRVRHLRQLRRHARLSQRRRRRDVALTRRLRRCGALPDIPAALLVVDPDDRSRLYLGTDLGVFVSTDAERVAGGRNRFRPGCDGVAVADPRLGRTKRLFAFTHGRGAWRVDLR